MSRTSGIEWTEHTWNPVVGCTKVSPGCKHCYAETLSKRLTAMGVPGYEEKFTDVRMLENRLGEPLKRRTPSMYFVNSMSDLFHERVKFAFIDRVMATIRAAEQHVFQILTKRPERMAEYFGSRTAPANAWLGVSVENRKQGVPRIGLLRQVDAAIRFLSVEPLLEDVSPLDLAGISWVIVGGESGPRARPMKPEWAEMVKMDCQRQGVPFFFKQWGAWGADGVRRSKKENGRLLAGREWNGMPSLATA